MQLLHPSPAQKPKVECKRLNWVEEINMEVSPLITTNAWLISALLYLKPL